MKFDLQTLVILLIIFNAMNTGLIAYNGKDLTSQIQNQDYVKYLKYAIGLAGVYSGYNFIKTRV